MKILQKVTIITSILTMLANSALAFNRPPIAIGGNLYPFSLWPLRMTVDARTPIFNKHLYLRGGVDYYNDADFSDIGEKTVFLIPAMIDIHPYSCSGFKFSVGLIYNGSNIIGGIGIIMHKPYISISPIASIGYDSSFISDSRWSPYCEIGIMIEDYKFENNEHTQIYTIKARSSSNKYLQEFYEADLNLRTVAGFKYRF